MGGSAFSSLPDAPYTPRMPPAVYQHVKSAFHTALRELFVYVATPIEGPEKTDHGDVDILVALERRLAFPHQHPTHQPQDSPSNPRDLIEEIKHLLNAEYAVVPPGGTSANLAIRWPKELDHLYVQADVRICRDLDQLCWILFKHAHGDIWNLIGSTIRPFGLTVDEEALWIRIPEIEQYDRKIARVCLTQDPVEILQFLGLQVEGFWTEPFESVDKLFEYVTTSRLFWIQPAAPDGDDAEGAAGVLGREEGRKTLKSNDRRRMKGRPVYRRWINEYIPSLRAQGQFIREGEGKSVREIRDAVRDEAFAWFFVEAEYKNRLKDWQLKRADEEMKSLIKSWVPDDLDPQHRSCLVSALRKIIMEDDLSFGVIPPSPLKDDEGFYKKETVCHFVQQNWQLISNIAWEKQLQRAREAMKRKAIAKEADLAGNGQNSKKRVVVDNSSGGDCAT
ncbi:hypothetical protein N656DRAFT_717325 [Canariomyces notabilis]|uniref:Uncharacterized protein n=1 Tax=Canariomyces notabilis TaxID=2074819 RepID=A0AAN6QEH8_9PEZI|nr:hypothetical protein N656DRAFT_717325 [Canariomyces arenarius]